jgi:4-hydroxybenzoate polyprenyltransferase
VLTRLILPAVAVAGVVVSVIMVLLGLPEATPAQSVLLELSSLPLSVSVAAGVAILHLRASRPVGRRSRVVLSGGGAAVAFGLVLMVWAYLVGPRGLVHAGQLLVWLGLLAALLVMLRRQPRRRLTRFSLLPDDESDEADDAPAAREQDPSL